jgi:F-type H+-transporting ATPase subunit b
MFVPHLASSANLFDALGVDWVTVGLNAVAFLIIAILAERFIFPTLLKALDTKRKQLEDAERLRGEAKQVLQDARAASAKLITQADQEAHRLVRDANQEAVSLMQTARDRAADQSRRIEGEAKQQLAREVDRARAELRHDTAELVAAAAGRVLRHKLSTTQDARLIAHSLETES